MLNLGQTVSMLCGGAGSNAAWLCSSLIKLSAGSATLAALRFPLGVSQQRRVISLTLTRKGAAMLRHRKRVRAMLTFSIGAGPGLSTATRTFKIALTAPARR
jgi:hypothetical protein